MNNVNLKDRYSNRHWTKPQDEIQSIRDAYKRGNLDESEKHRYADRLHELCGSLRTAYLLVPLVHEQHRRSIEWALERLLSSAASLGSLPYVDQQKRDAVTVRVDSVLKMIDGECLDEAEGELRALESEVTAIRMHGLDRQVETLLASIDVASCELQ